MQREDWMSMTGMLKTYTKDHIKPKREEKDKKHIDSYNPATSSRELNPYWRDGGSGLPQTPESFRKSKPFLKPTDNDDDDYYSKSRSSRSHVSDEQHSRRSKFVRPTNDNDYYSKSYSSKTRDCDTKSDRHSYDKYKDKERTYDRDSHRSLSNWRQKSETAIKQTDIRVEDKKEISSPLKDEHVSEKITLPLEQPKDSKYLSDEKMNKLAAKILKAEILGDTKLVTDLQTKLQAAREYRKKNPMLKEEDNESDDRVMLISTNSAGNSRPLTSSAERGDPRSKSGKRKAETHVSGERMKYFGNDDKYDLKQMVSSSFLSEQLIIFFWNQ